MYFIPECENIKGQFSCASHLPAGEMWPASQIGAFMTGGQVAAAGGGGRQALAGRGSRGSGESVQRDISVINHSGEGELANTRGWRSSRTMTNQDNKRRRNSVLVSL